MYRIKFRHYTDSSHQLPDTKSLITKKCCNMHGHTYAFDIDIETEELEDGFVVDFTLIKNIVDIIDHRHINDVFNEYKFNKSPTSENIGEFIFNRLSEKIDSDRFGRRVVLVSVLEGYKGETKGGWTTYTEDKRRNKGWFDYLY